MEKSNPSPYNPASFNTTSSSVTNMEFFGVFMTNQPSSDGKRFSTRTLMEAVFQGACEATPTHLTHDVSRLVGWSCVSGLYIAPDMDCVMGRTFIPESDEEISRLEKFRKAWLTKLTIEPFYRHGSEFLKCLYEKGLTNSNTEVKVHYRSILSVGYDGLTYKAFPKLKACEDRYGIIPIDDILKDFKYLGSGVFQDKHSLLCVMLHPYFRKSLSPHNNYNLEFLESLFSFTHNKKVRFKVRIDPDFIGYAPSFLMPMEFEHIYGPKFSDDIASIKQEDAVYQNTEQDHEYYHSAKTEYNWRWEHDEFTFEMEDVNDFRMPSEKEETYGCYYVHSQYDTVNKFFQHFDGAIRAYDVDKMLNRLDNRMVEAGKHAVKTKLFCLDGEIPLADWKKMIMQFTYGTPSVYEYFNQQKPPLPEQKDPERPSIYKFVPYKLAKGDGVRLYISFDNIVGDTSTARCFSSRDVVTMPDGSKEVVLEDITKDLADYFADEGVLIDLPDDCKFVSAGDRYFNVPVIAHGDDNTQRNLNETWRVLREYVNSLSVNADFATIAFSLAWGMNGKQVTLSFAGHVCDLNDWMRSVQMIPITKDRFGKWLDTQSKFISKKWRSAISYEREALINGDGILYFNRRNIELDATYVTEEVEGKKELALDISDTELDQLMKAGAIKVAPNELENKWIFGCWFDNN